MNYIFVERKKDRELSGLVIDNRLKEFYVDNLSYSRSLNNIYRGKVKDVIRGMDAAFVDLGMGKNAYLSKKDALPLDKLYGNNNLNIVDVVSAGEDIIVQVIKEPVEGKGARITRHIELAGRYIVLTPFSNKINISRKIDDSYEIKRLEELGRSIIKNGIGFIVRTAGENEIQGIVEEYESLLNLYGKIRKEKNFLPSPKLIHSEISDAELLIRDNGAGIDKIIVNNKELHREVEQLSSNYDMELKDKLFYNEAFKINQDVFLMKELNNGLSREVELNSGGSIIIDEVEALTVIDVNTGSHIRSFSKEDMVTKTNLEAAEEIVNQVRLRGIGGIIIVDFIRMNDKSNVQKVIKVLEEELGKDSIRSSVIGMTRLGLLELTRRKTRKTLKDELKKACNNCQGTGLIPSYRV